MVAICGASYWFFIRPTQGEAPLARRESDKGVEKKTKMLVRRHSTGDHAFLPNKKETAAKKASKCAMSPLSPLMSGELLTPLPPAHGLAQERFPSCAPLPAQRDLYPAQPLTE